MANVNITEVRLLAVPLENDYMHTLYFESLEAQTEYFTSKKIHDDSDFSYQRKDKVIRYPMHIDSLWNCNYVMYKNSAYTSKWFYAFITKMEYVNDGLTNIFIETDVMQSWMFKPDGSDGYTIKPSFVEREHVSNDAVGLHTVPEQVEHGDYICNLHSKAGYAAETDMRIVLAVTADPETGSNASGGLYNQIYSGLKYLSFPHTTEGYTKVQAIISGYDQMGKGDAIVCMFLAPEKLAATEATEAGNETTNSSNDVISPSFVDIEFINGDDSLSFNKNVTMTLNKLDGYTPDNNKLLCYPYRYLLASNNAGCAVPFQFENFYNSTDADTGAKNIIPPFFRIESCITPGCSIRLIPMNYKGAGRNDEEGINLGKFPILNWTSDVYTNWLTQNGVNIGVSLASSAVQIIGGAAAISTGAGAVAGGMAIASGVVGVSSTIGEVYAHSMHPPQAQGNINSGDIVTASGNNDFHFYDMSIKKEYAQIIDGYFNMYGYKVNKLKIPEKNHRKYYWYTKCIDVNITGAIPMEDMNVIKSCYNKGITFWRYGGSIKNYDVDNSIV